MTNEQKEVLKSAMYHYVSFENDIYDAGNMDKVDFDYVMDKITRICLETGIEDQVYAYLEDRYELRQDQALYRAECRQANL